MLRWVVMALLCLGAKVSAEVDPRMQGHCAILFAADNSITYDFEPELSLNSGQRLVRWKNAYFKATDQQFVLLKTVLEAKDGISYDSLVDTLYGAGRGVEDPINIVQIQICRIRRKFREIDPQFDRIHIHHNVGIAWQNPEIETIQIGPLAVGKTVQAVWFKDSYIKLPKAEHTILLRVIQRGKLGVHKESLASLGFNLKSIPVLIANINARFKEIVGDRIVVSAKHQLGLGMVRLNPQLLNHTE